MFDHRLTRVMHEEKMAKTGRTRQAQEERGGGSSRTRSALTTTVVLLAAATLLLGLTASYLGVWLA